MIRVPDNSGGVSRVGLTKFGWLYCTVCRCLLRDRDGSGIYPDVCPGCKGTLDYGILDELKRHVIELD